MNLFQNIVFNYTILQEDFIDLSFNLVGIWQVAIHILIATGIFVIFYLFGEKVRKVSFKENKKYNFFINIALGYIVIGTGIGILGAFSLLKTEVIWGYLGLVICIAFIGTKRTVGRGIRWIRGIRTTGKGNFIVLGVLLFVLIAFLRLMTPEIGEDGYHTDLPRLYLTSQTTIHEARDPLRVIPYPQLAEMIYVISIFWGDKEATRFIHFGFYVLIIMLLFSLAKQKEFSFARYSPLLFVTTPVVIKYSPSSFIDFFLIFCFLLSILLLEKKSKRQIVLSGLIFGGAIATKLWILIYLPALLLYIAYLHRGEKLGEIGKKLMLFPLAGLAVGAVWYIRDFIITGSPIYPVFAKTEYLESNILNNANIASNFGFNWRMFMPDNLAVLSPLFFLGIFFSVLYIRKVISLVKRFPFVIFFLILTVEQLMIGVYLGRHLLAWYSITIIVVSAGVWIAVKHKLTRYAIITIYFLLFSYYFSNTLVTLPYGFGWADQNKYLTRVLGRDNANYYDFDHLFGKWISKKDSVAMYGIYSYYYVDFSYIDVNYVFSKENRSFDLLKQHGATKLLLKGGDIKWFCKILSLTQCDKNKVQLLATWPSDTQKYNLYQLR